MSKQRNVDYYVYVEEMGRPLGKYHFAAHAVFSEHFDASQFSVHPPQSEVWGVNETEVLTKVRNAMQEWATKCGISVTLIP